MRQSDPTYTVENAEAIGETDAALKVTAPEFDEPQWVPKSQIHDDSEIFELGGSGRLVVSQWIAEQRGWVLWEPRAPTTSTGFSKRSVEWRACQK